MKARFELAASGNSSTVADDSQPSLTADVAAVTTGGDERKVLLIERGNEPFKGRWALPGGFLEPDERLEQCARRELAEETGLEVEAVLDLLGVYDDPGRDPRGRIVSAIYIARVAGEPEVEGGDDAAAARWWPLDDPPALAFDHDRVLSDLRDRLTAPPKWDG